MTCLNIIFDVPEANESRKMAVLDTEMWLGTEELTPGIPDELTAKKPVKPGKANKVILYQFYKKHMANKIPNLEANAIPESQKISTAVNEIIRRFKNTSRSLKPDVIEGVLKSYMDELAAGRYPHQLESKS